MEGMRAGCGREKRERQKEGGREIGKECGNERNELMMIIIMCVSVFLFRLGRLTKSVAHAELMLKLLHVRPMTTGCNCCMHGPRQRDVWPWIMAHNLMTMGCKRLHDNAVCNSPIPIISSSGSLPHFLNLRTGITPSWLCGNYVNSECI